MTRSFRTTRDGMFGAAFDDKVDRVAINAHAPMPKVRREPPSLGPPLSSLSRVGRGSFLLLNGPSGIACSLSQPELIACRTPAVAVIESVSQTPI